MRFVVTATEGALGVRVGEGWDSTAILIDATWVERTARRPDVEPWLRTETRLLPWLAPQLPLPVPQPWVVGEEPLVVRHRVLRGRSCPDPDDATGQALGHFLRALHDVPLDDAVALGVPDAATTRRLRHTAFDRFAAEVLLLLPPPGRTAVATALDRLRNAPTDVLVHGDLHAEHVLVDDHGAVTGVIDWSDARAGDTAKDLAWLLTTRAAAAVIDAYGEDLTARAVDWATVGPCYAVTHGLDTGDEDLVRRAVAQLAAAGSRAS